MIGSHGPVPPPPARRTRRRGTRGGIGRNGSRAHQGHALLERGVIYVPQGRNIFPELSVRVNLELGATVTLQTLLESEYCPEPLKSALKLEAPLNIRNSATIAGTLVACDGRSTFANVLLAMDAKLEIRELENWLGDERRGARPTKPEGRNQPLTTELQG